MRPFLRLFERNISTDLDYSTTILLRSGQLAKAMTYQDLVYNVLGKSGFLWLSVVQFLYPFICLISYNIIIGTTRIRHLSLADHSFIRFSSL